VFNIDEVNRSCEAGILVSPELHGKGTATEILYTLLKYVFEERKFHRTTFETGVDNVNMAGWLQNVVGARLEAERKECWKEEGGKYTDVHSYAILEWEWADRIKGRLEGRIKARASS
jgi:RimJ/RimL family protein N-acetyltransferase